jgi:hypothetical protein
MGSSLDEETGNAEVWCDVCEQPLTHADEYGMHCDNECEREIDKACASVLSCVVSWSDGATKEEIAELISTLNQEEK